MSILIDTHGFLWAGGAQGRLSKDSLGLLDDPEQPIFLSIASAWEIAIKSSKGRLHLPTDPLDFIERTLISAGISRLMIGMRDVCSVANLPFHHKDPFDRLLVAQARNHGLRLMTADPMLERYDVDVIALWLDDEE